MLDAGSGHRSKPSLCIFFTSCCLFLFFSICGRTKYQNMLSTFVSSGGIANQSLAENGLTLVIAPRDPFRFCLFYHDWNASCGNLPEMSHSGTDGGVLKSYTGETLEYPDKTHLADLMLTNHLTCWRWRSNQGCIDEALSIVCCNITARLIGCQYTNETLLKYC